MTFYERYELLCGEHGMKPQTQEMQDITGVSSPSISGWKNGSMPKADVLCRLAKHFDVTTDYLLGLSEVRNSERLVLTDHERLLIEAYRAADAAGQMNIVYVCMDEKKKAIGKGETVSAG